MKYPQLVPTRAVNAISDWLVSRLEQLGVEAPQIYTRLLLSLLQSSVQINDPIEFSNLETFFANRKGHNRRYLPCDTDTLKKLNAVQCLREIVSSEQEIATIEHLVDELCEKLKDIEKQSADIEDEDPHLLATLSVAETSSGDGTSGNHHCILLQQHHPHQQQQQQQQLQQQFQHHNTTIHTNKHHNNNNNREDHLEEAQAGVNTVADLETDPKKRYFRAFPALSKEMEDSFRVWRRNAKSLTWPVVQQRNHISSSVSSSSSNSSSSTNSSSFVTTTGDVVSAADTEISKTAQEFKIERIAANRNLARATDSYHKRSSSGAGVFGNLNKSDNVSGASGAVGTATTGVKRKSKRRRNQALSKGKTIQNIRKNSTGNTTAIGAGIGSKSGTGRHHRNSSPTYWDTDFEGCWEMGRDLIKEFIIKQQNKQSNRNRSTSESAAYNMKRLETTTTAAENNGVVNIEATKEKPAIPEQRVEIEPTVAMAQKASSPLLLPMLDISFCCDEDDCNETLTSVSELVTDTSSLSASAMQPRRLYQRSDDINFGSHELLPADAEEQDTATAFDDDQLDFAQFKAKFNSSVEALWKDADPEPTATADTNTMMDAFSLAPPSSMQMQSLPAEVPFKENLKNFWNNYYNHHFDLAKIPQQLAQSSAVKMDDSSSASLSCSGSSDLALNVDLANTSDYYSMPSNLDDFDKNVGAVRREFNTGIGVGGNNMMTSSGERSNTPIGLFLQPNSIWSDNLNAGVGDSDESFYFKVWNSTKKLNQLDAEHGNKITTSGVSTNPHDNAAPIHSFPPFNSSKWSEGINAGPIHTLPLQQYQPQQLRQLQTENVKNSCGNNNNNSNNNMAKVNNLLNTNIDCTDSSTTASVSTTSCSSAYTHSSAAAAYSWQTPVIGQSLQADLNSWSSSNPMSLTEMYGGGIASNSNVVSAGGNYMTAACEVKAAAAPSVTLPNHSSTTSGFIEYSRIKAVVKVLKPPAVRVVDTRYVAPVATTDDENLLTSERTHFTPIKAYADGHTFDICSSLDAIDYERSDSGSLYLESEKYLEYTRNDSFMAEEEHTVASTAPLYAASNCEAAINAGNQRKNGKPFVLKFRVRNCEIGCQTEDPESIAAAATVSPQIQPQHPLCMIFSSPAAPQATTISRLACNDAIDALNKAVAAAAKAAAAARLPTDSHWLPSAATNYNNVGVWSMPQDGDDEIDFTSAADDDSSCGSALKRQWSMREIGKKCQLKGHQNSGGVSNNNNNNIEAGDSNTLWSMCAACNSECKSVPANSLLRDELQQEADEIMSDLKDMQDLYIERATGAYDAESKDCDWVFDTDIKVSAVTTPLHISIAQEPMDQDDYVQRESVNQTPQSQVGLLQPVPTATDECLEDAMSVQKHFSGSLWYGNDERNIWQPQQQANADAQPQSMPLLRQFNIVEKTPEEEQLAPVANVDDQYLAQLGWEHKNLAEIWQKHTPPQPAMSLPHEPQPDPAYVQSENEVEQVVTYNVANNCENLLHDTKFLESIQIPPAHNTTATCKRVQQFLNTNAAITTANAAANKINLAANRKRRHSASQNFFHLPTAHFNNNNNVEIADLNRFNLKLNSTAAAAAAATAVFADDIDMQKFINTSLRKALGIQKSNNISCLADALNGGGSHAHKDDAADADADPGNDDNDDGQPKQTIITCKYWTTIEPMAEAEAEDATTTTTFSCLIDKNSSILKHVTMVTRPLTR